MSKTARLHDFISINTYFTGHASVGWIALFTFDYTKFLHAMVNLIILILFYIFFPVFLIWLTMKYKLFKKIGAIVIAYAVGIIIANVGILPKGSQGFRNETIGKDRSYIPKTEFAELRAAGLLTDEDIRANNIGAIQGNVQNTMIPLALPLILFSLNVKRWLKFSGKGFLSMILALVSVMVIVATGYLVFRAKLPEAQEVAGMLIGCYTGGTVNMASIAVALNVPPNTFVMTNTYDMIVGGVTILFFVSAGPAFFRLFLPPFKSHSVKTSENFDFDSLNREMAEDFDDFSGMFKRQTVLPLLGAFGIAVLILALALGVGMLLPKVPQTISVILTITILGVAASFIPRVRNIKKSFQLGMYFIIAFSLVISSRCDLSVFFQVKYIQLLLFVTWAYFGSLFLHLFLSWIFRVDADDYLITTTGFVYSPPFVPMVAAALKNKDVILTGLATGILGWMIGNIVGIGFGTLLGKIF